MSFGNRLRGAASVTVQDQVAIFPSIKIAIPTERPEEEARRLDEERNRAQGGGAETESTETAPADLGVKTMPKGDLDIYTKPKDPTGGCGPGMHRGADGQCYPNVN